MRMPSSARRRLLPLSAITAAGILAAAPAAMAAGSHQAVALASKPKTYTGTETPNGIGSTGGKRTVSFQLSGYTISKLTFGPGTASCTATNTGGDAPFTLKTKALTFPTIKLNHGTYYSPGEGLELNATFVRNSGSGPFTYTAVQGEYNHAYSVYINIISNVKETEFGSKIDGDQLPGITYDFYVNAAGQVGRQNLDLCTVGGNVLVKLKK